MEALTIQEAAETTGWSPRMLRYVERVGLIEPARSAGGYRLYGPAQLQRLRTLRELLQRFDIALSDFGFAQRLRQDPELRAAVDAWFEARPRRPADVPAGDWLRWEQEKHQRLLHGSTRADRSPSAEGTTRDTAPDLPLPEQPHPTAKETTA
jgi:MerR family transcriptional regulator, copper efflux regulator